MASPPWLILLRSKSDARPVRSYVRDGLKPVHRRVLYAMAQLGNRHDKPYKKSAPKPAAPPAAPVPAGSSAFSQGRLLLLQGRYAEAVRLLGEAAAQAPAEALYRGYYAKALWQSGAREEALREYDSAVQLSPGSVEYRKDRALAYMALDRRAEAAGDFELVLQSDPNQMEALRALAQLKAGQGDGEGSAALLKRALQIRGGDPELVQDLAYALEKSGQLDEAADYMLSISEGFGAHTREQWSARGAERAERSAHAPALHTHRRDDTGRRPDFAAP